jgi:hypothetical protein
MGAFFALPYPYLVPSSIPAECELRDVISTLVPLNLTHPNTPLLSTLFDLLGVYLVRFL